MISAKAGTRLHWYGFAKLICVVMKRVLVCGQRLAADCDAALEHLHRRAGPAEKAGNH